MEIPLALQLYSVREDCARDLLGTLKAIAKMGFEGVEFAGYYEYSADDLNGILKKLDLKAVGTHIKIEDLIGDKLDQTIRFNKTLGNQNLIIPSLPDSMINSKVNWLHTAQLMNNIAKKIKPEGLSLGYHNHPNAKAFQPINGELPWNIFCESTSSDIILQLDAGNAMREGLTADEIVKNLSNYHGRLKTVHLKEYSSKNEQALLGEGEMNWPEFFNVCETLGGTKWYIIEQENCPFLPLECARVSLKNFKKIKSKMRLKAFE
jgi:sugar phosphate isomerase/epimerase